MSSCYITNEVPVIVKDAIRREVADLPIGHYLHPDDPSNRTALCGAEILGVPTGDIECVLCSKCAEIKATLDS